MKFGKLQDISKVNFDLPPDPPGNLGRLSNPGGANDRAPHLYIGCTGWSMKEWVGRVYPGGTKAKDFLKAYSQQFNTIELNTTHYRIPDTRTIAKWYQSTTADFRFCPKVPQSISHSKSLGLGTDLIPAFCHAIEGLQEKLGCCFIQLPPYFGADRLPQLEQFLRAFPSHIQLAVEARHESWFNQPGTLAMLLETLYHCNRSMVITDVAGRRDVLHMGVTSPTTMVRFVGNGLHPTDFERSADWAQRLKEWAQHGVQNIYFFPHEPDNLLAPEMAAHFHTIVTATISNLKARGPELFGPEDAKGEQISLF